MSFLTRFRPRGAGFHVGCKDFYLTPADGQLHPDKHLSGRLFYPTTVKRWNWPSPTLWIPHSNYAYGYTNSLMFYLKGWKYAPLKALLRTITYVLGTTTQLAVTYNAPLLPEDARLPPSTDGGVAAGGHAANTDMTHLPVIIFSHGLVGNRNTYSSFCIQMASQGYVVLAIEHTDGTASCARLAMLAANGADLPGVHGSWRFYPGWNAQSQYERTKWRGREVMTGYQVLEALNAGQQLDGLTVSGFKCHTSAAESAVKDTSPVANDNDSEHNNQQQPKQQKLTSFLAGRLDMSRVSVAGHSWGGATAALVGSQHPQIKAVIAMDPWWEALPLDAAALNGQWHTQAPMLVLGSHAWNTPNASGRLACGGREQEAVLKSAATGQSRSRGRVTRSSSRLSQQQGGGPGAILLVPRNSSHHSFDDVLLFFGNMFKPVLKLLGMKAALDPTLSHQIITQSAAHFLATHMPSSKTPVRPGSTAAEATQATAVPIRPYHKDAYQDMFGADVAILRDSCAPVYASAPAGQPAST